jgi:hypothetical protein
LLRFDGSFVSFSFGAFSLQQIHKIPGTTYAQGTLPPSSASSWDEQGPSGGSSADGSSGGSLAADASFKAKMESLHDPTSTNLYMEGWVLISIRYF